MEQRSNELNSLYSAIYQKWRKAIMFSYIIGWAAVTMIEIVAGIFITRGYDNHTFTINYFLLYVAFPALTDLIFILIAFICVQSKKITDDQKNYILIATLFIVAIVIASVHSYFHVIPGVFLIPIFSTIVFLDKKLTIVAAIMSVPSLLISAVISPLFDQTTQTEHRIAATLIMLILIGLSDYIAFLIVTIHHEREDALAKNQQLINKLSNDIKHDSLTGLYNIKTFHDELEAARLSAKLRNRPFTLCMLDIDNFKYVNDTFGHAVGDTALKHLAVILKEKTREFGAAYRYGGDEFAVIINDPSSADAVLEDIRKTVAGSKGILPEDNTFSISLGIYTADNFEMTSQQIFYKADLALYQAKLNGKNRLEKSV